MIEKFAPASRELQLAEIGLNQQMLPVFWGLLFAAAIAWIFLSRRLYGRLKHSYPEIFEVLGKPALIMKDSLATNYRVIMFLFRGEHETINDIEIIRLCQGLRYVFLIFVTCFLGSLLLLF